MLNHLAVFGLAAFTQLTTKRTFEPTNTQFDRDVFFKTETHSAGRGVTVVFRFYAEHVSAYARIPERFVFAKENGRILQLGEASFSPANKKSVVADFIELAQKLIGFAQNSDTPRNRKTPARTSTVIAESTVCDIADSTGANTLTEEGALGNVIELPNRRTSSRVTETIMGQLVRAGMKQFYDEEGDRDYGCYAVTIKTAQGIEERRGKLLPKAIEASDARIGDYVTLTLSTVQYLDRTDPKTGKPWHKNHWTMEVIEPVSEAQSA